MSIKSDSPSQTQSNPTTPPGRTATYISVVNGTKMKPKIGQYQVSNAWSKRAGLKSHQTKSATRGPRNANVVKMQHISLTSSQLQHAKTVRFSSGIAKRPATGGLVSRGGEL